ncbi:hypothetical protein [Massilia sp. CT11-137]|jgi:hypothetical protein|uniref:hypothetical protein n=1 Tax=Massilia sp. CT11-137 TaxID=3393901 RepID=UPI0039AF042E
MSILDHIRAARKSFTVWMNAVLLAAYPFADSIIDALRDNLPDLAPYLPANVFRAVGLALVVYNIVHGARAAAKAAKENHAA